MRIVPAMRRVLVGVIAVAALAGCGTSETGQQVGAYRACERAVETSLKAPSTAEFPGFSAADITVTGDLYSVSAYVDAENSFGANVRTPFTCTLRSTGDNWELVDLSL